MKKVMPQYPLQFKARYRVLQPIGGLEPGECIQGVGQRSQKRPEERLVLMTLRRANGSEKEIQFTMGPTVAASDFEKIR